MPTSPAEIRVRRFSTPTVTVQLFQQDGSVRTLSGHALRYTVTQIKAHDPETSDPPHEFQLLEIAPTITSAANGQITIAFTLAQTSLPPGRYPFAEVRGRTDGVAPVTPVKPHYADELPLVIFDTAEVEP